MTSILGCEVSRVRYGGDSVFVEFICFLVLISCRNDVGNSVMSTSCSAGVNFYYWIKPLAVTGLQRISKRLVSLVSNREVGRVRNGGGSVLENL